MSLVPDGIDVTDPVARLDDGFFAEISRLAAELPTRGTGEPAAKTVSAAPERVAAPGALQRR